MRMIRRADPIVRESMQLSFRGSEWWGIELDALSNHTDLVRQKFLRDIAYAKRPSTPSAVAIHLRGTLVTPALAATIAAELDTAGPAVRRVALVGLDRRARRLVRAAIRAAAPACICAYFSGYEQAKEWLIPR